MGMSGQVAKSGERSLVHTIPPDDPRYAFESQIRDCFGRAAYTHKTHEKMAERKSRHLGYTKWALIILSALTTGGAVGVMFDKASFTFAVATALLSFSSLIVNSYTKNLDPGAAAQKHREAANKIWLIRERYLSLLADIRDEAIPLDRLRKERDAIQTELAKVYSNSPQTDGKAYGQAQNALKRNEDLTFAERELDDLLPTSLKRGGSNN